MKKLLLLGGSSQQVIAIETAKRLGYYTILCDYLSDNPGQYSADKFYLVSTTDKEAVLEVAQNEKIDGILAYASDPAAPTAAYVAEKLNLPGNPYESVEILCNKDKFRNFLNENGFCTPVAKGFDSPNKALDAIENGEFCFPIIIKPVDSSGSKGVTVLKSNSDIKNAVDFAFSFSREKRIVVEEFIEKKHPYLIGGDIFVIHGKIVIWGLMNCHRDMNVNSLVPVGKSYPPKLDPIDFQAIKDTLQKLVTELGIKFGPMNVELIVDMKNRVFPVDIGPRSGGNMIPDLLGMIFDVDLVEMSVKAAVGMPLCESENEGTPYYVTHNLHSAKGGIFQSVEFSDEIKPYIIKKCIYKKVGDQVEYFDDASKALGIIFLKFESEDQMMQILQDINQHITIVC